MYWGRLGCGLVWVMYMGSIFPKVGFLCVRAGAGPPVFGSFAATGNLKCHDRLPAALGLLLRLAGFYFSVADEGGEASAYNAGTSYRSSAYS